MLFGLIADKKEVHQPPHTTASAGEQLEHAETRVAKHESVYAELANENGNQKHNERLFVLNVGHHEDALLVHRGEFGTDEQCSQRENTRPCWRETCR